MTFGEKLKLLLKDCNMTQEELAEKLEVSRQAVGKWVNDKGIPEVGKLIQISNLFGVSLDELLKEEYEEKIISNGGYYVSEERLEGYLSYSRQKIRRLAGGISLFLVSDVFEGFGNHNLLSPMLHWGTRIAGVILVIWQLFQIKQYQEIRKERLIFEDQLLLEFKKQSELRRKKYVIAIILGTVILLVSPEIEYYLTTSFDHTICNTFGRIADTAWIGLALWAGMSMYTDGIVIKNARSLPEGKRMKRYQWVYAALPVTAAAVLIGIITNAWSPMAPVIILFCCLLTTTCKLLIEGRGKNE